METPSLFGKKCQLVYEVTTNQIIKVPQWNYLQIDGSVTCHDWDGNTGGIVCFKVKSLLTISDNATITANEKNQEIFDGGAGGDYNGKNNGVSNNTQPGTGVAVGETKGKDGGNAIIDASDIGWDWKYGLVGHRIIARCESDFDEQSGDGGWSTQFPGEKGGNGEREYFYDPNYDNHLFTIGNAGKGGNGGSGPGSGGDGGGGSKGDQDQASSSGTAGDYITTGSGGNGGAGGAGGGGIIIKAKEIIILGDGSPKVFQAKGGDGIDATDGSGNGGDAGNGGAGADGSIECENNDITYLEPQGAGGAPGRAGNGADGGIGGNGGDGGIVWLVTDVTITQIPTSNTDGVIDVSGGTPGNGGTTNGLKGQSGVYGSPGNFSGNFGDCCDGADNKDDPTPGDGGGSSQDGFAYQWVTKTEDICDCRLAFKYLTIADASSVVDPFAEFDYSNSTFTQPSTKAQGEVYQNSKYELISSDISKLTSRTQQVLRNHDPDNQSGYRLIRNYYCDMTHLSISEEDAVFNSFEGISDVIITGSDDFSNSVFRSNFQSTNSANSIGYYDANNHTFYGFYWNGYDDYLASLCFIDQDEYNITYVRAH